MHLSTPSCHETEQYSSCMGNVTSAGDPCPPMLPGVYRALACHSNPVLKRNQVSAHNHGRATEAEYQELVWLGVLPIWWLHLARRLRVQCLVGDQGIRTSPPRPYVSQSICFLICKRGREILRLWLWLVRIEGGNICFGVEEAHTVVTRDFRQGCCPLM